jgi:hypothetical protein
MAAFGWISCAASRARDAAYMGAPESISRLICNLMKPGLFDFTAIFGSYANCPMCHSGVRLTLQLRALGGDHPEDGPLFDQVAL